MATLPHRYTGVAMALHWLTAALAVTILPVAWAMTSLPEGDPGRSPLFNLHKSLGLTIGLLIAARLLRRAAHPEPPLDAGMPRPIVRAAALSHWLLYAVFALMPVSGFAMSSAGGRPVRLWGLPLPGLPKDEAVSALARATHHGAQWLVYALVLLHILAVVWHVAIRRDGTLGRMLPEQTRDPH